MDGQIEWNRIADRSVFMSVVCLSVCRSVDASLLKLIILLVNCLTSNNKCNLWPATAQLCLAPFGSVQFGSVRFVLV